MRSTKPFSVRDRFRSVGHAWRGVKSALRTEHNLWIDLFCAAGAIALGCIFDISAVEWVLVIITIGLVISAEIFNTSIEYLADAVSTHHDTNVGRAKDIAAGAVFILAIMAVVVGAIIFGPRIVAILTH